MAKLCQICLIRSTRRDTEVTFGRFFHFLHTKSKIPIKARTGNYKIILFFNHVLKFNSNLQFFSIAPKKSCFKKNPHHNIAVDTRNEH